MKTLSREAPHFLIFISIYCQCHTTHDWRPHVASQSHYNALHQITLRAEAQLSKKQAGDAYRQTGNQTHSWTRLLLAETTTAFIPAIAFVLPILFTWYDRKRYLIQQAFDTQAADATNSSMNSSSRSPARAATLVSKVRHGEIDLRGIFICILGQDQAEYVVRANVKL